MCVAAYAQIKCPKEGYPLICHLRIARCRIVNVVLVYCLVTKYVLRLRSSNLVDLNASLVKACAYWSAFVFKASALSVRNVAECSYCNTLCIISCDFLWTDKGLTIHVWPSHSLMTIPITKGVHTSSMSPRRDELNIHKGEFRWRVSNSFNTGHLLVSTEHAWRDIVQWESNSAFEQHPVTM